MLSCARRHNVGPCELGSLPAGPSAALDVTPDQLLAAELMKPSPRELEALLIGRYEDPTAEELAATEGMSLKDMLTKPWDGFDVFAEALDPAAVPATQQPMVASPADESREDFDIEELLAAALAPP
jgi:hypothetical protein